MNNKVFSARITWLTSSQGGRKGPIPFENNRYMPIISINGNTNFEGNAWSVICYSYEFIDQQTTKAYMKFFMHEKAPDILFERTEFKLQEGGHVVASGIIDGVVEREEINNLFRLSN